LFPSPTFGRWRKNSPNTGSDLCASVWPRSKLRLKRREQEALSVEALSEADRTAIAQARVPQTYVHLDSDLDIPAQGNADLAALDSQLLLDEKTQTVLQFRVPRHRRLSAIVRIHI